MSDALSTILDELAVPRVRIAELAGTSRQHLYRIENGESEPTSAVIAGLLAALNRPEHLEKLGRSAPITFEELFGEVAA